MANKSLVILPEAEHDLTQTYTWYEEQEIGLGEKFLRCVDACLQLIPFLKSQVTVIKSELTVGWALPTLRNVTSTF